MKTKLLLLLPLVVLVGCHISNTYKPAARSVRVLDSIPGPCDPDCGTNTIPINTNSAGVVWPPGYLVIYVSNGSTSNNATSYHLFLNYLLDTHSYSIEANKDPDKTNGWADFVGFQATNTYQNFDFTTLDQDRLFFRVKGIN